MDTEKLDYIDFVKIFQNFRNSLKEYLQFVEVSLKTRCVKKLHRNARSETNLNMFPEMC